jgi:hypothetical protein
MGGSVKWCRSVAMRGRARCSSPCCLLACSSHMVSNISRVKPISPWARGSKRSSRRGSAEIREGHSSSTARRYMNASDDGNNAAGGGPVEFITDVDFAVDRFRTDVAAVTFAANMGAGTGGNLNASANNAIAAAFALNGSTGVVAAQFTFGGHTYLAIDQTNAGVFDDAHDLSLDITGTTGTIATSNFI